MALKPPWPMTELIVLLGNELCWDASVPSIHVLEQMPPPSHPLSLPREEITLQMSSVAPITTPHTDCGPAVLRPSGWNKDGPSCSLESKVWKHLGLLTGSFPLRPCGLRETCAHLAHALWSLATHQPWCKIILETLTASLSKNFFTTLAFGLCSLEKEREKTGK